MTTPNKNAPLILETLIVNEELLSTLYKKYSAIFSSDSGFWDEISNDETTHASWLYDLGDKVASGEVYISNDRFNNETFKGFGDYVQEKIDDAHTGLRLIDALSIAKDIENSMLEMALFKIYDTDDQELKSTLNKLRESTEIHCAEINKHWRDELDRQH